MTVSNPTKIPSQSICLLFISLIVYFELILISLLIFGNNSNTKTLLLASSTVGIVFLCLFILLMNKNVQGRDSPNFIFLCINLILTILFVKFFVPHFSEYSVSWLSKLYTPGMKLYSVRKFEFYNMIFESFYIINFIVLHFFLLSTFFKTKNLISRYFAVCFFSFILVNFFYPGGFWYILKSKIWDITSFSVTQTIYWLLKITGFNPVIGHLPHSQVPVIGTQHFAVAVYWQCSGMGGILTFLIALLIMVTLNWDRIILKKKIWMAAYIGSFVMYTVNILRIFILVLLGHFFGHTLADHIWHSTGSIVFYCLVIITILNTTQGWFLADGL